MELGGIKKFQSHICHIFAANVNLFKKDLVLSSFILSITVIHIICFNQRNMIKYFYSIPLFSLIVASVHLKYEGFQMQKRLDAG